MNIENEINIEFKENQTIADLDKGIDCYFFPRVDLEDHFLSLIALVDANKEKMSNPVAISKIKGICLISKKPANIRRFAKAFNDFADTIEEEIKKDAQGD